MSLVQRRPIRHAIAFALSLTAAAAFADPVIVNGSFESPAYGAAGIYSGGGDGWTSSFMGPVVIVNGNIVDGNNKRYGVTPFGVQYLGLDVRSANGFISRDSQTIPGFVKGQRYLLTLDAADSDGGVAPQLDVLLGDGSDITYFEKAYDLPVGGPYKNVIQFHKVSIVFKSPVTDAVTLSLTNSGTAVDAGSISIDNVAIRALTAAEADAMDAADAAGASTRFVR